MGGVNTAADIHAYATAGGVKDCSAYTVHSYALVGGLME